MFERNDAAYQILLRCPQCGANMGYYISSGAMPPSRPVEGLSAVNCVACIGENIKRDAERE